MIASLAEMMARHARDGRVTWIGLRPARREAMELRDRAEITEAGIDGDRARAGKRAVTLIQAEHLPVIASLAGLDAVPPELLRRNIVVEGLGLMAFRNARLRVGTALLRIEGPCAPCSRMEAALGHGGYNAMRGHGGVCASVIEPGFVAIDDLVRPEA